MLIGTTSRARHSDIRALDDFHVEAENDTCFSSKYQAATQQMRDLEFWIFRIKCLLEQNLSSCS